MTFTLVKQDFKKATTYLQSIKLVAIGGALGSVGDTLTNPIAIMRLDSVALHGLAKSALGGAIAGVFAYWMRSQSPSAPPAPVAAAEVVVAAAKVQKDAAVVKDAAEVAKVVAEDEAAKKVNQK